MFFAHLEKVPKKKNKSQRKQNTVQPFLGDHPLVSDHFALRRRVVATNRFHCLHFPNIKIQCISPKLHIFNAPNTCLMCDISPTSIVI